jgi:hypothetical protein
VKLDDILLRLKQTRIDLKTRARWNAYATSARQTLARCYAYDTSKPGVAKVIASEAAIVVKIVDALARGMTPSRVKHEITDPQGLRNRSGRLWTVSEIARMPRMIFAGKVRGPLGWRSGSKFEPIVKVQTVKAAQKTVRRTYEGLELALFDFDGGAMMQPMEE